MGLSKVLKNRIERLILSGGSIVLGEAAKATHMIVDRTTGDEVGLIFSTGNGTSVPYWYKKRKTRRRLVFIEIAQETDKC